MKIDKKPVKTKKANKKLVFRDDGLVQEPNNKTRQKEPGRYFDEEKPFKKPLPKDFSKREITAQKAKKIVFNDDGEVADVIPQDAVSNKRKHEGGGTYKEKRASNLVQNDDGNKAWYSIYCEYNTNSELLELKENELRSLTENCRSCFEANLPFFIKKNPSDTRWLQTALHKGTAKDRVNSGALLVHSNPTANLDALQTLIGLCKVSNRVGSDILIVLTELFMEALIPSDRKLMQVALRGADWKALRNRTDMSTDMKEKIYAYWHFEAELKDQYFEFLKNLQSCLQTGKDPIKNAAIVCTSKLLCHGPEKEQVLLSMLVNKLGDPINKVAAKALHHLSEVTIKHPNMCGVIATETEKLLFRNNISEQAQHYALCFLAQIAHRGQSDVCTKLVNICFAFFKVLVKKGAVNNRTMQAILRCLQKSIVDAKPIGGSTEVMNKEMQDTVYRLVHLADIQISIQTLSLLLQLITVKGQKSDRFYNALYRKMIDLNLISIGTKPAAQFFHILHRAIYMDPNISRALAFLKRLLQISMYMPAHMICGSLVVVNKILKSRPELRKLDPIFSLDAPTPPPQDIDLSRFDSDAEAESKEENKSEELELQVESSWNHLNLKEKKKQEAVEFKDDSPKYYDPYHRVPAFAGAQFVDRNELTLLQKHFHPSCRVFSETNVAGKAISYYGDPLRDFSLSHFLERFVFKNPKKIDADKEQEATATMKSVYGKAYTPQAGRAQPVQSLTKENCTEEERFIFEYLEKKREQQVIKRDKKNTEEDDVESVNDDEFDAYLDSLSKNTNDLSDEDDDDVDFLKEMSGDLQINEKQGKKKKGSKSKDDEESEDDLDDWNEEDHENESEGEGDAADDIDLGSDSDSGDGSISHDENEFLGSEENDSASDVDDGSEGEESSDEKLEDDYEPKMKKSKRTVRTEKDFNKKLKRSNDMSSLFAAADDFAELLEETSKDKRHGTSSAIFNQDKSSEKQLKWEEKRRQKGATSKRFISKKFKKVGKNKRK